MPHCRIPLIFQPFADEKIIPGSGVFGPQSAFVFSKACGEISRMRGRRAAVDLMKGGLPSQQHILGIWAFHQAFEQIMIAQSPARALKPLIKATHISPQRAA